MTLDKQERERFAAYCREYSASNTALAEQMKKLRTPSMVIDKYLMEASAFATVAAVLEKTKGG